MSVSTTLLKTPVFLTACLVTPSVTAATASSPSAGRAIGGGLSKNGALLVEVGTAQYIEEPSALSAPFWMASLGARKRASRTSIYLQAGLGVRTFLGGRSYLAPVVGFDRQGLTALHLTFGIGLDSWVGFIRPGYDFHENQSDFEFGLNYHL